jgi:Lon protease-like protein
LKKNNFPVFPLGIVALPGSIQSLQIFEPRYMQMVKNCLSENHGFVIVFDSNLKSTSEIIDFNNLPNGLLGITVKSINKVVINNTFQQEDGLHIADTKPDIDPEVDDQAVLAEYPEITSILSQLLKHPRISDLPMNIDFGSADSVAYHLAGLIPLSSIEKQKLLEAFDATQRMRILADYIQRISTA